MTSQTETKRGFFDKKENVHNAPKKSVLTISTNICEKPIASVPKGS